LTHTVHVDMYSTLHKQCFKVIHAAIPDATVATTDDAKVAKRRLMEAAILPVFNQSHYEY